MIRIRSIDPHEFCYVDIKLYSEFFEEYNVEKELSFAIELSKLSRILAVLTAKQIFMRVDEGYINFSTKENWVTIFGVKWLRSNPYILPEPDVFEYEAIANISAEELADLIQKASTISHEISFSAEVPNKLMVFAIKENYSFTAYPSNFHFQISVKQPVSLSIIADYLKTLTYFISKCESAKLFIGNDKPLRVDLIYGNKGVFSFSFSYKKKEKPKQEEKRDRVGTSLPRISMKLFEKYLIQLSRYPDGADPQILEIANLETKGKDCWRLSDILTLAYKYKGKIKLTPVGEAFASLYEKDKNKAKYFLHMLAKDTIIPYNLMIETLETPVSQDELRERINVMAQATLERWVNGEKGRHTCGECTWLGFIPNDKGEYDAFCLREYKDPLPQRTTSTPACRHFMER